MKTNLKNQKGITLVALVVTIIVLLILAGVSISLVAGGEGILSKASNAVDVNNIGTAKERVAMEIIQDQLDFYEAVYVNKTESVNTQMGDWIYDLVADAERTAEEDYVYVIEEDGNDYTVTILRERSDGIDSRLKADITGTLTQSGKLSWGDEGNHIITNNTTTNTPEVENE